MKRVNAITQNGSVLYIDTDFDLNYMWLQNTSNNTATFSLNKSGTPNASELYYSFDKLTWTAFDLTQTTNTINVPSGRKIWFRGNNSGGFNASVDNRFCFSMSVTHKVGGDIRSIISSTGFESVTTMPNGCFCQLFIDNTNLTSASDLLIPFYTIPKEGLRALFNGCTSLTNLPLLTSITTVGENGFRYFAAASQISSVDVSGVVSVGTTAFSNAFSNCSNLNQVKCPNMVTWDTSKFSNWLSGVSSSGTFEKPSDLTVTTSSASGVPTGWTTENYHTWLSFTNTTTSNDTLQLKKTGSPYSITLEYSTDKINWNTWTESGGIRSYTIPSKGTVWIRGNNSQMCKDLSNYYSFAVWQYTQANGTVMSLLDKSCTSVTIPKDYTFACLFNGCSKLRKAPALTATVLKKGCYYRMFYYATGMNDTTNINLGATTLVEDCYDEMFSGVTNMGGSTAVLKVHFTNWYNGTYTTDWVKSFPNSSGTFYKPSSLSNKKGDSYIPSSWTVSNI